MTKSPPTVHWVFPFPTPYGEVIFRALHEADFVNLLVHYGQEQVPSHPWKTNLRKGHKSRIQTTTFLGIDWFLIKEILFNKKAFFVGGWSGATLILMIIIALLLKRKFIFQTDAPNIYKKRYWFFSTARTIFLKAGFRWACCAILHTGDAAFERLQIMGAAKEKMTYFPYWANVDAFWPPDNKRHNSDLFLRFVSVGRVLNKRKGHDDVIRALEIVSRQNNNFDFEYIVAGTGPDVENLNSLAKESGIAEKVKIAGWLEPDELIKLFHEADVLIHPSPVDEPYGVAVIEAMAAGLVVVASDVTFAALDRIEHGINGYIYKASDVEELADRITWCFKNKDRLLEIGVAARKTASQWPVSRGVTVIKEVLHRSGAFA